MNRMIGKISKKYKEQNGETIIETMYSLLMVVLALTMLAGSLLSATKVNTAVKNQDTSLMMDHMAPVSGVRIKMEHGDHSVDYMNGKVMQTKEKNGYILYYK